MRAHAYAICAASLLIACPSTALDLEPEAAATTTTEPAPPAIPTVRLGPDFLEPLLPFDEALLSPSQGAITPGRTTA